MEVVTYIYQSDGRPAFKHETETDICLFHMVYWKVDDCQWMESRSNIGLLLSTGSANSPYPQNAGQTWSYYTNNTQIDDSVIVRCEN